MGACKAVKQNVAGLVLMHMIILFPVYARPANQAVKADSFQLMSVSTPVTDWLMVRVSVCYRLGQHTTAANPSHPRLRQTKNGLITESIGHSRCKALTQLALGPVTR